MLMLDTNIAINIRDGHERTLDRLALVEQPICLSIITVIELEGGAAKEPRSSFQRRMAIERILEAYPVLPLRPEDVLAYRGIVETLGFSRAKLLDRMIGSQALVVDATLATLNARDFCEISNLNVEDWTA